MTRMDAYATPINDNLLVLLARPLFLNQARLPGFLELLLSANFSVCVCVCVCACVCVPAPEAINN